MPTTSAPLVDRPAPAPRRPLAAVPDTDWTAGEWVEVARVRLAPVVHLDDHRPQRRVTPRRVLLRRRLTVFAGVLAVAVVLALTAGGRLAGADLADPVGGQAVVAPGETLWDVAVANAPEDVDPRHYLERIRELNGLPGHVPAWTVVLLPHD